MQWLHDNWPFLAPILYGIWCEILANVSAFKSNSVLQLIGQTAKKWLSIQAKIDDDQSQPELKK